MENDSVNRRVIQGCQSFEHLANQNVAIKLPRGGEGKNKHT